MAETDPTGSALPAGLLHRRGEANTPDPHPAGYLEPGLPARAARRSGAAAPFDLTPREREVLCLVAEGRTDREIGDALLVSFRTASSHVASILAKLGVASRTGAAAVAVRQGLA